MERISIHAPRTGSDNINYKAYGTPQISIHAPRTGSDANLHRRTSRRWYFNPRSPHGERQVMRPYWDAVSAFQSTLPARGATRFAPAKRQNARISIHAPRTGSDSHRAEPSVFHDISIHAPRTGSDGCWCARTTALTISIHAPRTGSDDNPPDDDLLAEVISIHAPRTGSDTRLTSAGRGTGRFQSTLPARGATMRAPQDTEKQQFQSTLPARGATLQVWMISPCAVFQSTLPARGATCSINIWVRNFRFQSTLPARGATYSSSAARGSSEISIHAPRTGSDLRNTGGTVRTWWISIHAPRTGSDEFLETICKRQYIISIHAPRTGSDRRPVARCKPRTISIHAPRTGSDTTGGIHP